MPPEAGDRAHLWDMWAGAERLAAIMAGVTQAEFLANDILQLAAERLLQNIGEAARRVSAGTRRDAASIPWTSIIGQRNVLVHEYGEVKPSLVWRTIERDIPELLRELRALLVDER